MNSRWVFLSFVGIQAVFFTVIARHRLIDADEGLYLMAAKLVSQGKTPYSDFFYQQTPALPYVYGAWMSVAGVSWASGRLLSAIFAIALGTLLYAHVAALFRRHDVAFAAGLLYTSSSLIFAWHSVVKTYALSNLLLFGAYLAAYTHVSRGNRYALLSGLLLGCAVDTRLYLIAAAPVLAWWIHFQTVPPARSWKSLSLFLVGLLAGLAPNLLFFFDDANSYAFDNLTYHLIRDAGRWPDQLKQKLGVLLLITNIQPAYDALGGQFALLTAASILTFSVRKKLDSRVLLPLWLSAALCLVCLVPSPAFSQYFCVVVPFLIITAAGFYEEMRRYWSETADPAARLVWRGCIVLFLGAYAGYGVVALQRYLVSGQGVAGIESRDKAEGFRLSNVRQVSAEIARWVRSKGEAVASFWPGYLIECECSSQPGMENQFGLPISERLPQADARKYKIITRSELLSLFRSRSIGVAVIGNADFDGSLPMYRRVLVESGYNRVSAIGTTEIYLSGARP